MERDVFVGVFGGTKHTLNCKAGRATATYTWAFLGSGRAEKNPVEKLMARARPWPGKNPKMLARARPQPDPTARGPTR